jgi:protein arginine kinase
MMVEKTMKFDPSRNCPFNSHNTPFGDVVLSSRARLARNLEGFPFVNRATSSDCTEVASLVHRICDDKQSSTSLEWVDMDELDSITNELFVERHLTSARLAHSDHPRAIAIGPELARSVMVNEEDHIRIQSLRPGLQIGDVFNDVFDLDVSIERVVAYAFDEQLGYLTSCPTNLGTGARFSVMLHLPGLRVIKDLPRVRHACEAMGIAIRGYRGEGSDVVADLYQVSNQVTLGYTEEQLCKILAEDFLPPVIEWERKARMSIAENQSSFLDDQTFRSLGLLQNARLLNLEEAMQCLGNIRLGICMNRIENIEINTINQLLIEIHPAHLRWRYGEDIDDVKLPQFRSELLRDKLSE